MSKFSYKAKNNSHQVIQGTIEADNLQNAIRKITAQGYAPIDVNKENQQPNAATKALLSFSFKRFARINSQDKAIFILQMYELTDSGLPLLKALQLIKENTKKDSFKKIIEEIFLAIEDGKSMSEALALHPHIFPSYFIAVIYSGEISGTLNLVLQRLSELTEKEMERNSKIKSSLIYPLFILCVGALTVFILLSFVVPKLTVIFDDLGHALPLPTVILIAVSHFLSQFWWVVILVGILMVVVFKKMIKTPARKEKIDALRLKIPVYGKILKDIQLGRFTRTLGTLLEAGVDIVLALEACLEILDNGILKTKMQRTIQEVKNGQRLTTGLIKSAIFEEQDLSIVAIGEESGKLEKGVIRLADRYEKKSEIQLKTAMALLEPGLILGIGAVIAFVVSALLLPIFEMNFIIQ